MQDNFRNDGLGRFRIYDLINNVFLRYPINKHMCFHYTFDTEDAAILFAEKHCSSYCIIDMTIKKGINKSIQT